VPVHVGLGLLSYEPDAWLLHPGSFGTDLVGKIEDIDANAGLEEPVEPEVELAKRLGAQLGPTGAIAVDERLATSVPHVWAAGDCTEVRHAVTGEPAYLPLGSLANRQGRTLANIIAGRPDRFPPVVGAAAVKVFDRNVAATGCTAALARQRGLRPRSDPRLPALLP